MDGVYALSLESQAEKRVLLVPKFLLLLQLRPPLLLCRRNLRTSRSRHLPRALRLHYRAALSQSLQGGVQLRKSLRYLVSLISQNLHHVVHKSWQFNLLNFLEFPEDCTSLCYFILAAYVFSKKDCGRARAMRVISIMKSLEELRRDISHMDEVELLAFGRKVRSQPDSDEYKEAQADWKRRQEKKAERERQRKQEMTSLKSSWDVTRLAVYARPGAYPWACFAITRPGHFEVVSLPKLDSAKV